MLATAAGTGKCAQAFAAPPAKGPDLPPPAGLAIDSQNRILLLDTFGNPYTIGADGTAAPTGFPRRLASAGLPSTERTASTC
jgi:hypothetical protein